MSIRLITSTCVLLSFVLLLGAGNILAGQAASLWGLQEAVDVLEGNQPYAEKGEAYGQHFMSEYWYIAHTGTPVRLTPEFWGGTEPLRSFAWDYESDGIIDYISKVMVAPEYTFKSAGEYTATLYAIDLVGGVSTGRMHFKVEPGYGEMVATDPPMFDLTGKVKGSAGSSTDSATYVWIVAGDEDSHYGQGLQLYRALQRNYQFSDSSILFMTFWDPEELVWQGPFDAGCESLLVDIKYGDTSLGYCTWSDARDSSVAWLYEHLGSDDRLLMFSIGHGEGMPDSDVVVTGKWLTSQTAPFIFTPTHWRVQGPDDADQRLLESEAPTTYNYAWMRYARTVGMNEWYAIVSNYTLGLSNQTYYREKLVARYDTLDFWEADTLVSDSDVWFERIGQFLKADANHNFGIDQYEYANLDHDSDGNPPVDTNAQGEFVWDEDDWGDLSLIEDKNGGAFFDAYFDGIADMGHADTSTFTVYASDSNNDGMIIGYDWNADGDMLDSVGADAYAWTVGYDDYLAAILDSLDYRSAHIVMGNCFSGGFINDVSRENVSIITYAPDGATNCGSVFGFTTVMLDSTLSADANADSLISLVEAFNASVDLLNDPMKEYGCWYDDNGDGEPTIGEVPPASLDGDLGDDEFWGTYYNWQLPESVHPSIVSPVSGDTITTVLNPVLKWSIDTTGYDSLMVKVYKDPPNTVDVQLSVDAQDLDSVIYSPCFLTTPVSVMWSIQAFYCDTASQMDTATFVYDWETCCIDTAGNVNGDTLDVCDISDLTYLINYLFITFVEPPCMAEAQISWGDCSVDISDLDHLTNYLFNDSTAPRPCSLW